MLEVWRRPRLSPDLVALIQRIASENPRWGAERIRGELLRLSLPVAKDTIQTYLHHLRPPRSPSQNWSTFLKNHAKDVWACDFLLVIDLFFRTVYVIFIVEWGSRRVMHFGVTQHPTEVISISHKLDWWMFNWGKSNLRGRGWAGEVLQTCSH